MDVIKRKLRGKQMVIEGLISENALLRQSLHQRNRATLAKESREASSSNVLQSGYSEVPSNSFVTQPQCHSEMQQSHKTQVQHEKQIRQPVMQDTQYATHQRQERLMPSSSQAQKLPTQSSVRNKLQEQLPAADLEEIESFFHKIQHQLQSSQNDGNGTQLSVNSGQTQQSSNQTPSKEQIETNLEVTYVTSVRTVQTQKRTPNLQPMQIDQRNNPCRTVPQQNLQRSSLPSYHSLTHNLQTSQQSGPGQGLQSVNQVHLNSTQKHVLPQHSPQQHFVKGHQPHKHLHKKTSTNLQLPNNSPQLVYAQRHQNTHQFHNSLPQNHHSIQHTPQTSFQNHINPQQIPNNASHNVHPPLQSPQPEIQRFHNPQQIQNNTNYHVQPSQQNLQWVPFVQQPTSKCIHHFPPPQQAFQGSPNLMPPQHSPSIGPLPQQAKSIQEYSTSQQGLQRQHLPPSQFGNHQSVCNVQINPPPLLRPDLPSETFHRPQHSPQNQELRPKPTKVMPPPNYRAPLLPQQNQQLNVTPQHSQAVSSSSQQMSLSRGLEEARYQLRGSQRSYGSSKKRKQQNIEDKRISDLSSIQNPLGQMHVSHTDSPDPPQQNKEPHITQPQSSPSNHTERHKNLSSPVMESNQKAVSSNQQNSDSLPSTSTVHYNSCTQNESVPDNEKARKIEEKISAVMCQEKSGLVETSKENTNYVEGPFLEIVKEEPLSDLPDNSMETSPQWSNIGKKISIEDSLGVSEFFHLEEITASVPVAKLSNRPEYVSGPKKRSSVGESSLDRNTDIPPQSIITPPQTPPTPIPSTSARGASPGLSINATQVMKALAYQAYHHGMVETDFTYCNAVQDNENNMPVPNNVSDETKAPIDSLPTLDSPVLQRNKSNDSASFSTKSKTIDTSIHNSEGENSISKTSEKGSGELVEKLSLENNKDNLQGISGHVTDLASPNPEDGAGLTKAPDNSPQEELQDAELIASNSVETDKKSKISGCQEFSFPKNRNSQESRGSEEEITILEQACTEEISSEQACKEEISSEQACTKEISSEQACKEEISSEQACTKEISSEQACTKEISSEQACTKEISSEQACTKEISSEQACTKEISSEQGCTKEKSSEQACTKEISSEQACTKEKSSEQACTKEMCLEQASKPSVSSNIECSEVCPSNCSEVDKPSENSFDKEGNDVDRFQPGRYKECVTNSVDSEEKSQQIEYLIETVESDSVEGGNCSSLLENSLSDLDGLVEYVHISDYPDECEKKIFTKWEEIVDGQTDYEVCHNESNVTERRWRIEKDTASDFDKEKNGSVLEIFLSVDEVTGKLTDQNKIPEWCPMCYTDICPSRITVNADTFDMKAICIGCDLTILMIWGSKTQASIDEERPCPKSKKRRLNSVPKLLFVRH